MRPSLSEHPKILFLQHHSIFEGYGGVEYYIDDFLNFLSELYGPKSVSVVLAHRREALELEYRPYSIQTVKLSQGILRKFHNRFSPHFFLTALKKARNTKPTVIVASHISMAPLAAAVSKLTRIPFLVIAYGIDVWGHLKPQDLWALRKSNGIISISQWTKDILVKQGFSEAKITIVHPSLNSNFLSSALQRDLQDRKTENSASFRLLTISRIDASEQYKGHDHVIEALQWIAKNRPEINIRYTIQGSGNDLPRLKAKVEKLGLGDRIDFSPPVRSREDLRELYSKHDVFIMPSRFGFWDGRWRGEGFGIVYVEAGVYGLPSIAYRCGGVMDIVEDQKNGILVQPDNISDLAEAILKLATNKTLTLQLGEKAREMAMSRFAPEKIKIEMQKALDSYIFLKKSSTKQKHL